MINAQRKRRHGARKSKAERLAKRAACASVDNESKDHLTLDTLKEILTESNKSDDWDRAQHIVMRLANAQAKAMMIEMLLFLHQAPRAAVHYATRIQIETDQLVPVLLKQRQATPSIQQIKTQLLLVAKFLADAPISLIDNTTRVEQFLLSWLNAREKVNEDENEEQPKYPSMYRTAIHLVLQTPSREHKLYEQRLDLQRVFVARLAQEQHHEHAALALQYTTSYRPQLESLETIMTPNLLKKAGFELQPWPTNDLLAEQARRRDIALRLEKLIQLAWPDATVYVFGSSATGLLLPLHRNNSTTSEDDVDLVVLLPSCGPSHDERVSMLLDIKDHLSVYGIEQSQAITNARVPIIHWLDPISGLPCDLCINNMAALYNTTLFQCLLRSSNTIIMVSLWLKQWLLQAKRMNQVDTDCLSSYGMQLLVFYFFQHQHILPRINLESLNLTSLQLDVLQKQVEQQLDSVKIPMDSFPALILGFFKFYTLEYDYQHLVISLHHHNATKIVFGWEKKHWQYALSIQDPIEQERDLGRLFSRKSLLLFRLALFQMCIQWCT